MRGVAVASRRAEESFTVIIPTTGRSRHLTRTLGAIPPTFETIVVHDGEEADPILVKHWPAIRFLSTGPNRVGPAVARNRGSHVASGRHLVFVDDDIHPGIEVLSKLVRAANTQPDHVYVVAIVPAPEIKRNVYVDFAYSGKAHRRHFDTGSPSYVEFCTSFAAVPRAAFERVGGFEESFTVPGYEDVELGFRLTRAGVPLATLPGVSVSHLRQMDRSWFIARCERNGALLRRLHQLHPETRSDLPWSPSGRHWEGVLWGASWPVLKHLLPLAEMLPRSLGLQMLRLAHAAGIACSYRTVNSAPPPD